MTEQKAQVQTELIAAIRKKRDELVLQSEDLNSSLTNETKSTSGDKHETARAMVQMEMEEIGRQIDTWSKMLAQAQSLPEDEIETISLGAYVETNRGSFYLSVGYGRLSNQTTNCFCIAPTAPLAAQMLGKKEGDSLWVNQLDYKILKVF